MEKYEIAYIVISLYVFIGCLISRSMLNAIYHIIKLRDNGCELTESQELVCKNFDIVVGVVGYRIYYFLHYLCFITLWLPLMFKYGKHNKRNKI